MVELVVFSIVCEEEDMAANLRAGFKVRQCKRLSKSIIVILISSKRPCSEILFLEPVLAIAPMQDPSAAAVGTNPALDERPFLAEGATHLELGRSSSSSAQLSDDFVECVASVSPPSPGASCP